MGDLRDTLIEIVVAAREIGMTKHEAIGIVADCFNATWDEASSPALTAEKVAPLSCRVREASYG
jgi:hypothetical protein